MKLSVIIIGDEILIGQVTDTNSGAIARTFGPMGWDIAGVRTVPDDADAIRRAVTDALADAELVVCTGGLGPTKDDITKHTLACIFGGTMRRDPEVTANIERVFALRGLRMNELTAAQVIQNRFGTAPVMWFERDGRVVVSMPGVPFETEGMLPEVAEHVARHFHAETVLRHHCLMVGGVSESALAQRLAPWESSLPSHLHLAYLPVPGLIRLRLDGRGTDAAALDAEMDREIARAKELIGDNLRFDGDVTAAGIALDFCRRHGYTLGTAESCTGGTIAQRITSIAGCSDVFAGSVVSYANSVETGVLGVSAADLDACGAVSREVVEQMAEGARRVLGCDCAVATSGIAGPGGAVPGKPVGTVCIAVASPWGVWADTFHFPGNRERVIDRATTTAIIRAIREMQARS